MHSRTFGVDFSNWSGPINSDTARRIHRVIIRSARALPRTSSFAVNQENINIETEVQDQPDYVMDSEEIAISDTPDLPEPVAEEVTVQTQQVPEPPQTDIPDLPEPVVVEVAVQTQQVPESPQTDSPTIIEPEWVKKLELYRTRAETKMAAAALMNAEAVKKMAEASLMNAKTNRMNAETNRLNAETIHKQLELMKADRSVVGQPSQPRSAGLRPTNSLQNKTIITMCCPKCDTKISHTMVLKALQEKEPSENRRTACKRSRQRDSSVESEIDAAVNEVPSYIEVTQKQARTDSNSVYVKTEPQDDEANDMEPDIDIGPAAVNEIPSYIEVTKKQARTDPNCVHVKTEPQDDEANDVEPEIDVGPAAVNQIPSYIEVTEELARTDPNSLDVKTEPRDDEANENPLRDRRDLGNPRKAKDHMPNRMEKYQRCKQCAIEKERKSTRYKCNACNVYLCAAPCFVKYHSV